MFAIWRWVKEKKKPKTTSVIFDFLNDNAIFDTGYIRLQIGVYFLQ